ncbi:MAG: hypothetical protein JSW04_07790, partial [Desulfobacterales bacterium]
MIRENHKEDPLKKLAVVDPDLAARVNTGLLEKGAPVAAGLTTLMVEETLWALSQEIAFGHSVAMGYVDLFKEEDPGKIKQYKELVREFGNQGPTLGKIMAIHLVPVIKFGSKKLVERF